MFYLKTRTTTVLLFHLVKKQKAECIKWGTHQKVLPNHMLNVIFAKKQTSSYSKSKKNYRDNLLNLNE
ncbi:hypothetical protein A7D03_17710 [Aeromonas salmonicida]|nr:hypothetical protein A7D03_17710 [Aeromonas salmonicida]